MKRRQAYFFTLLLFFVSLSTSYSQDFTKQRQLAEEKFNEGKIEEAIALSEKILASAEKKVGKDHPEYAKSLQDLGVYHFLNYNNASAINLLEQALSVYAKNHIATHGYFLSNADLKEDSAGITFNAEKSRENPLLRSGLLLSGANQTLNYTGKINSSEEGVLTAYEAMSLDLSNTELVILSACETGLGEEMNGEGVFGLQRAFQLAGARNIHRLISGRHLFA